MDKKEIRDLALADNYSKWRWRIISRDRFRQIALADNLAGKKNFTKRNLAILGCFQNQKSVTVLESRFEHALKQFQKPSAINIAFFCFYCDLKGQWSLAIAILRLLNILQCKNRGPNIALSIFIWAILADNIAFAHGDVVKVCLRVRFYFFQFYVSILSNRNQSHLSLANQDLFYSARIAIRTEHCPFQIFKVADNIAFPHGGAVKVWVRVRYLFLCHIHPGFYFLKCPGYLDFQDEQIFHDIQKFLFLEFPF